MATDVTNYQCPACIAPLRFSSDSGKLECDYCGESYTVEEVEKFYAAKTESAAAAYEKKIDKFEKKQQEMAAEGFEEDQNLIQFNCPSCGAELISDETTAATSCPYCGNPNIIPGKLSGAFKPDYVIPFKFDKNEAIKALKKHYAKKPLLPSAFSKQNHIEEIKGVYVPFWLFDCDTQGNCKYRATTSRSWREGDYICTETKYYDVERGGDLQFNNIPVDASSKMPDEHMESIEPFDYDELKEFSLAYLPGFLADKFDVDSEQCRVRAFKRAELTTEQEFLNTISGYDSVTKVGGGVNVTGQDKKYGLLPVWMLYTKWQNKDFLFAMNGQTGKLIGDLPISWPKFFGYFAGLWAAFSGLFIALRMFVL